MSGCAFSSFSSQCEPGDHEVDAAGARGGELIHAAECVAVGPPERRRGHHAQAHLVADQDPGRRGALDQVRSPLAVSRMRSSTPGSSSWRRSRLLTHRVRQSSTTVS